MNKTEHFLGYNEIVMDIEDWSRLLQIDYETLHRCLLSCSFDLERAVEQTGRVKLEKLRRV